MKCHQSLWFVGISIALLNYVHLADAYAEKDKVKKAAPQYIPRFVDDSESGESGLSSVLAGNQHNDTANLRILRKDLAAGAPQVRENVVKLLEKIGLEADLPSPDKFPVIRNRAIIEALLIEGFVKDDAASDAAATILREQCLPSDLAAFGDIYLKSLQAQKGEYLYLVAKAKIGAARPYVDVLARSEKWRRDEEALKVIKIAQAALGNTEIEDEFIQATAEAERKAPPAPANRFYDVGSAKDGKQIAASLATLGLIGTRRSLLTVCAYLRSPMKTYVPNHRERSIRYDALDALRYNYPDERLLYRPTTLDEWAAAEAFCTRTVGAVFDGPTPDIPPDHVYPAGVSPRPLRR
ncbi:MAG: hypothetical protein AB1584_05800 [Pseudomonadota bacterium]